MGKRKGKAIEKNGNKYLGWAYVDAAHHMIRYSDFGKRFFQRKLAQRNRAVAVEAAANKLAKASYYIMRDQVTYDSKLLFT